MVYLDSSVALRHILGAEDQISAAFDLGPVYSSELMEIECRRVIYRYRMEGQLTDESMSVAIDRLLAVLGGMNLMLLSPKIKKRAMEPFPIVVRTLDALHLASAWSLSERYPQEAIYVCTYDRGMNLCAKAMGFRVPLMVPI